VEGLVKLFNNKFQHPPASNSIFLYTKLVKQIWTESNVGDRFTIISCLSRLDTDHRGYVMLDGTRSAFLKILRPTQQQLSAAITTSAASSPVNLSQTQQQSPPLVSAGIRSQRSTSQTASTLQFSQFYNALIWGIQNETNEKV
jgi:hypothetical protein